MASLTQPQALTHGGTSRQGARDRTRDDLTVEDAIEMHTREISQLIGAAETERQDQLRAYATDLLREETEMPARVERKAPLNPMGLAVLLLAMAALLLLFFPAAGILVLLAAMVTAAWGLIPVLFPRHR